MLAEMSLPRPTFSTTDISPIIAQKSLLMFSMIIPSVKMTFPPLQVRLSQASLIK